MMPEKIFPFSGKTVWVAGHRGMVGSAIFRRLACEDCRVIVADRSVIDLKRQRKTEEWLARERPDAIFLTAAKVGGILANDAGHRCGVGKLLFLGSSCIYPKFASQPMTEDALLTGALEPTNEWYAIAKIAGIKLCQAYRKQYGDDSISAMPTKLYGPGDNFNLSSSHVIPALIRKAH